MVHIKRITAIMPPEFLPRLEKQLRKHGVLTVETADRLERLAAENRQVTAED